VHPNAHPYQCLCCSPSTEFLMLKETPVPPPSASLVMRSLQLLRLWQHLILRLLLTACCKPHSLREYFPVQTWKISSPQSATIINCKWNRFIILSFFIYCFQLSSLLKCFNPMNVLSLFIVSLSLTLIRQHSLREYILTSRSNHERYPRTNLLLITCKCFFFFLFYFFYFKFDLSF